MSPLLIGKLTWILRSSSKKNKIQTTGEHFSRLKGIVFNTGYSVFNIFSWTNSAFQKKNSILHGVHGLHWAEMWVQLHLTNTSLCYAIGQRNIICMNWIGGLYLVAKTTLHTGVVRRRELEGNSIQEICVWPLSHSTWMQHQCQMNWGLLSCLWPAAFSKKKLKRRKESLVIALTFQETNTKSLSYKDGDMLCFHCVALNCCQCSQSPSPQRQRCHEPEIPCCFAVSHVQELHLVY